MQPTRCTSSLPIELIMHILTLDPDLPHTHLNKATQMAHWQPDAVTRVLFSRMSVQAALNTAARAGLVAVVEHMLLHATPRAKADHSHSIALWDAAKGGRADVCHVLLSQPYHPSRADAFGSAALQAAAEEGHYGVCKLLLEWPDHPARACDANSTALVKACAAGHAQVALLLLSQPQHAARANDNDSAALEAAAEQGNLSLCRLLLTQPRNAATPTPGCFFAATRAHKAGLLRLLNRHCPAARTAPARAAVLQYAARYDDLVACQWVCDQWWAEPVHPTDLVQALDMAITCSSLPVISQLLKYCQQQAAGPLGWWLPGASSLVARIWPATDPAQRTLREALAQPVVKAVQELHAMQRQWVTAAKVTHFLRALEHLAVAEGRHAISAVVLQHMPLPIAAMMQGIADVILRTHAPGGPMDLSGAKGLLSNLDSVPGFDCRDFATAVRASEVQPCTGGGPEVCIQQLQRSCRCSRCKKEAARGTACSSRY